MSQAIPVPERPPAAAGEDGAEAARPDAGLNDEQVRERMQAGLSNHVPRETSRSAAQILRENLFTLFNAVLGGCLVVVLIVGHWEDALFGVVVSANILIGVAQEFRAKRTLDRLAVLHAPVARVVRGGTECRIAVGEVVRDDVLLLRAGDQIPADARVLRSEGLEIDESLLTGESDPVDKAPGDEVLSGSAVIAGHGAARVVRVGAASFASRLTAEAKRFSLVNSELRNALNRLVLWITWALIPIMALVINGQMQSRGGWAAALANGQWRQAVVSAVAGIVGMIPEGLILLTSMAFLLAALILSRHQVLVQELPAVEGLARVDVVCLDKTGTLTEGNIVFDAVHRLRGGAPAPGWEAVLGWFGADGNANATARCLHSEFPDRAAAAPTATVPFSSARKYSAVSFTGGPAAGTWVLGAPEEVLAPGDGDVSGRPAEPGGHVRNMALGLARSLASTGLRTLVLARADPAAGCEVGGGSGGLPAGLVPAVVLTFREQIRADAAQTLAYFRDQGVGLRVISGDNPRTVAAVARSVGMQFTGDGFDARDLPADPAALAEVLETRSVFGHVTPAQKKRMVLALQERGHVVAMTGDGVNDALALKTADIGIAMGSGSDATKAVARLVLLDGRFSHLPRVVSEGRRVIANVERISNLFMTKTVYAIGTSLAIAVLLWQFPFLPRQLSGVSSLTIGVPAFFLALLPNDRRYRPGFLKRSLSFSVPAGLLVTAVVMLVAWYAQTDGGYPDAMVQAACTMAVFLTALWVLVVLSRPLDARRLLLVLAMYAGLAVILFVPLARDFFALQLPDAELLGIAAAAAAAGCVGIDLCYRYLRRRGAVQMHT